MRARRPRWRAPSGWRSTPWRSSRPSPRQRDLRAGRDGSAAGAPARALQRARGGAQQRSRAAPTSPSCATACCCTNPRSSSQPGANVYSFVEQADKPGLQEYEAIVNSDADSEQENNRYQAFVQVTGAPQGAACDGRPGSRPLRERGAEGAGSGGGRGARQRVPGQHARAGGLRPGDPRQRLRFRPVARQDGAARALRARCGRRRGEDRRRPELRRRRLLRRPRWSACCR